MFFGCFLMISGLNQLFTYLGNETVPFYLNLGILVLIGIFLLSKRYIIQPRKGTVKFGSTRRKKRMKALIIAISAQVFTAIVFYFAVKHLLPGGERSGLISLVIEFLFLLVVFSAIGYYTDYKWFYFIGMVMAVAWPVNYILQPWLHSTLPGIILQLDAGLLMFIIGLIKFIIFLRKHPIQGDLNYETE
jgi:hypothetical protein